MDLRKILEESKAINQELVLGELYLASGNLYQLDSTVYEPEEFHGIKLGTITPIFGGKETNLYSDTIIRLATDEDIKECLLREISYFKVSDNISFSIDDKYGINLVGHEDEFISLRNKQELKDLIALLQKEVDLE